MRGLSLFAGAQINFGDLTPYLTYVQDILKIAACLCMENLPMLLRSELSSSIALFLARNDPEKLVAAPISSATDFTLQKTNFPGL